MPTANAAYYGNGGAIYDDYDTMSATSGPMHPIPWKSTLNGVNSMSPVDVNFQTPVEIRSSYQIGLNGSKSEPQDELSRHMLYETALLDSKAYAVLTIDEVDALKKELARLISRTEAAQRKLALEGKVRDAAQNLQRLYSSRGGRADTPQSPESPKKLRRSLLGQRTSSSSHAGDTLSNAEDELVSSQKKVEELHDTIKTLLERRANVERKLLHHTAAILAEQREAEASRAASRLDDDAVSTYEPDEFDGIRDILGGRTINKMSKRVNGHVQDEHEEHLQSVQGRLERLNNELRTIIKEAGRSRGVSLPPEPYIADSDETAARLDQDLSRLEDTVRTLEHDQQETKAFYASIQDSSHQTINAVEDQLHDLNTAFCDTLASSTAAQMPQPPQNTGHGFQEQLQYLEHIIHNLQGLLQSHQDETAALSKSAASTQKLGEYESTVHGLWDLLSADGATTPRNSESPPRSPMIHDSFSLQAFSSRVQHFFDRATSAREQHDILRRQIQQQRELNGKSDAEKDRQIEDLQTNHDKTLAAHDAMQDELAKTMANHASSENEASQLRTELANVESEFEQLKKTADAKTQERDEMSKQLAGITAVRETHRQEMEKLEGEVVRLTTELTMAKAELDGAYGSRAERAREAQAGEVEGLRERSATLEKELTEMTAEFQDLTRESLELDRERSQLDSLIDGLRERCEALEAQLADEKVRALGTKPPANVPDAREQTTMVVLRQEFKKMVRDARFEGVKLLRAEQEERRKLEAEVRRLRQANTPLGRAANGAGTPA